MTKLAKPLTSLLTVTGLILFSGQAFALLPAQKTGNLYVSMWATDDIAVFTPDGLLIDRFTTDGLDGPRGIAFNPANGEIWVAGEFSNAIHVFDHTHQFLRKIDHPDFDEPVGITFAMAEGVGNVDPLIFISNSNRNEIMVFDQTGTMQRRFTNDLLKDPNCTAFLADGSLLVANRLGGSTGSSGSVSKFDGGENFSFDFTAEGISSLMAVALDPNATSDRSDDTVWVTSGAGDNGIYEFDQSGNILTTMLPDDIDDGRPIVPQGIAFDDSGDFVVISNLNEVIKFDGDGNFLMRFPTGEGTARSTAYQSCQPDESGGNNCLPLGVTQIALDSNTETAGSSGSGRIHLSLLSILVLLAARRCGYRNL
ncbi:MAG: hypothetical protein AB8B64_24985 [Granulosicoccus sp.]